MEDRKLRKYIFATIALIKKQAFHVKEKVGRLNKNTDRYEAGLLMCNKQDIIGQKAVLG